MFLGMKNFDFALILTEFAQIYLNFTQICINFNQIYLNFPKFYPNLPKIFVRGCGGIFCIPNSCGTAAD